MRRLTRLAASCSGLSAPRCACLCVAWRPDHNTAEGVMYFTRLLLWIPKDYQSVTSFYWWRFGTASYKRRPARKWIVLARQCKLCMSNTYTQCVPQHAISCTAQWCERRRVPTVAGRSHCDSGRASRVALRRHDDLLQIHRFDRMFLTAIQLNCDCRVRAWSRLRW